MPWRVVEADRSSQTVLSYYNTIRYHNQEKRREEKRREGQPAIDK
jgi:hypothetical protein